MTSWGGRKLNEATKRMIIKMISNDLARNCNLQKRNGKHGLKQTHLFAALCSKLHPYYLFTSLIAECNYFNNVNIIMYFVRLGSDIY